MDKAFIEFIKSPYIEQYAWDGDLFYIWVQDIDYYYLKPLLTKLCSTDDGIPAFVQQDCIYLNLSDTGLVDDYYEELRVAFPEEAE